MPGNPRRAEQMQRIRDNLDEFCDELASGLSDKEALARLGITMKAALYKLEQEDSAVAERLARARKAGAAAMMAETLDIADETDLNALADPVRVAQLRINVRQQLASKRDREQFGDAKGTTVNINLGSLHLQAMRHDAPALPVIEAEVIEVPPALPASLDDLL